MTTTATTTSEIVEQVRAELIRVRDEMLGNAEDFELFDVALALHHVVGLALRAGHLLGAGVLSPWEQDLVRTLRRLEVLFQYELHNLVPFDQGWITAADGH